MSVGRPSKQWCAQQKAGAPSQRRDGRIIYTTERSEFCQRLMKSCAGDSASARTIQIYVRRCMAPVTVGQIYTAACKILVITLFFRSWVLIGADAQTECAKQRETSGAGQIRNMNDFATPCGQRPSEKRVWHPMTQDVPVCHVSCAWGISCRFR
jgi:hypothetical protein